MWEKVAEIIVRIRCEAKKSLAFECRLCNCLHEAPQNAALRVNEINVQVFATASVAHFMHISGKYLAKKSFFFFSCLRASCKVVKHIAWLDFGQKVELECDEFSCGERHFPQVIVKFSQEFS